jgi:hypothetical protein
MYERSKRSKGTTDKESKGKQKAIILTWNINYGTCILQTYSFCDPSKRLFSVEMSCVHGVIMLNFQNEKEKSTHEI